MKLFDNLLYDFVNKYKKIVGLGDKRFDGQSNDVLSFINNYDLKPTISDYTRISYDSKSCVDNILTTFENSFFKTEVVEPCLSSLLR